MNTVLIIITVPSNSTSFMPDVATTIGRLHCELVLFGASGVEHAQNPGTSFVSVAMLSISGRLKYAVRHLYFRTSMATENHL